MSTDHIERDNISFEIDDGLDGVDDFVIDDEDDRLTADVDDVQTTAPTYTTTDPFGDESATISTPPSYEASAGPDISNATIQNDVNNDNNNNNGKGFLNYYSRYFQLNTQEFKQNLYKSILFQKSGSYQDLEGGNNNKNTDLYGPIWITATVVMVKFVTMGFINIIVNDIIEGKKLENDENRNKEFLKLIHSIWLFYGYIFLIPLVIYYISNKFFEFFKIVEIYGYCNINWVPIIIILDLFDELRSVNNKIFLILEYIVFVIGGVKTCLNIIINLNLLNNNNNNENSSESNDAKNKNVTLMVVLVFHVMFCILFRFMLW